MKQLTEKQKQFLETTMTHRKEKVEELAYKSLGIALVADIPVFELPYYILQRTRQVIEESFKKVDFKNPKLQKARKAFLKACLAEMRANVVVPEKKEEKDETDIRDNQCEPVVQEIVKMLLAEDLIFSDENYFDEVLTDEEGVPLNAAIGGYANALDEKLLMAISEHWRRASDKLWGVPKEHVKFSMLDTVLKKE